MSKPHTAKRCRTTISATQLDLFSADDEPKNADEATVQTAATLAPKLASPRIKAAPAATGNAPSPDHVSPSNHVQNPILVRTEPSQIQAIRYTRYQDSGARPEPVFTRDTRTKMTASRRPSAATAKTLADVLALVRADTGIPPRQKQEIASALHMTAKAVGRELVEIPAEPAHLRARLKDFAPAALGMTPQRWANIRSLLKKALTIAGLGEGFERKRAPFLPVWSQLLDRIEDSHFRYKVTAFARWCGSMGITPDQVNDDTLADYRACLELTELARRPKDMHRALCVAWNQAVDKVEGWPQNRVTVPSYDQSYALPWESFPESLRRDVDAYLDYLAGKDPLNGPPNKFRPASLRNVRSSLHEYLSAVVLQGRDIATLTCLADAIEIKDFENALRFFLARTGRSPAKGENKSLAHHFAMMIVNMARHWVKLDDPSIKAFSALRDKVKDRNPTSGLTEKNEARLSPLEDPRKLHELANLPYKIFKDLPAKGKPTHVDALKAQIAVAIEILLIAPIRRENLGNIEIGRHLITLPASGDMLLSIPGEEVKNGVRITRPIPPSSAKLISLYLQRYRPVLLEGQSDHLFPGKCNGAKQKAYLAKQITDTIRKRTGLILNAHIFRHLAAMSYLDANPGAYGVVRLLLGHKSVETTTRSYCGTETKAAFRLYDRHLEDKRNSRPAQPIIVPRPLTAYKSLSRSISRDGTANATSGTTARRKPHLPSNTGAGKSTGVMAKAHRREE